MCLIYCYLLSRGFLVWGLSLCTQGLFNLGWGLVVARGHLKLGKVRMLIARLFSFRYLYIVAVCVQGSWLGHCIESIFLGPWDFWYGARICRVWDLAWMDNTSQGTWGYHTSVNLWKSYLDLYSTYFTYVTHGTQLCAAKHNKEKKSISTLLISLICLTDLFQRVQFTNILGVS